MITVREVKPGSFERLYGNPTLTSLDGSTRAPLRTIMHASWSDADRAKFGVFTAERFECAQDVVKVGGESFQRNARGVLEQSFAVEPVVETVRTAAELTETIMGATSELPKGVIVLAGLSYPVVISGSQIKIACESHPVEEWAKFDDARIATMDGIEARRFWRDNKDIILKLAGYGA